MQQLNQPTTENDGLEESVYDSLPISGMNRDVTIHSLLDDEIDRTFYDADMYEGQNDGVSMHLTEQFSVPPSINSLSVSEINQIMDDIILR